MERLLGVMRNQAKQKAYRGESLGTLRWHVIAWYVSAVRVVAHERVPVRRGQRVAVPAGQDVLRDRHGVTVPSRPVVRWIRDPQAREAKALDGVAWMAENWALGLEPMLPAKDAA